MGPPPPFPFLVGCGRSGTTMFRAMFDSHPQMAIPGESYFVVELGLRADEFSGPSGEVDGDRLATWLSGHDRFMRWGLAPEMVRESLRDEPAETVPDAIRRTFALFAEQHAKPRYGDKTPGYVLYLDLLSRMFPEGRFLHLTRDGRDVALSVIDAPFGPKDVPSAAIWWRERVTKGREVGRRLGSERYREVSYERLVEAPEAVLREVCPFVDLEFDPAMLAYPQRADEVRRTHGVTHDRQFTHLDEPPTKGLRDWRTSMSREDLELFEALAGPSLSEFGYERAVPDPPLGARLRAQAMGAVATVKRRRRLKRSMAPFRGPS